MRNTERLTEEPYRSRDISDARTLPTATRNPIALHLQSLCLGYILDPNSENRTGLTEAIHWLGFLCSFAKCSVIMRKTCPNRFHIQCLLQLVHPRELELKYACSMFLMMMQWISSSAWRSFFYVYHSDLLVRHLRSPSALPNTVSYLYCRRFWPYLSEMSPRLRAKRQLQQGTYHDDILSFVFGFSSQM